LSFFDGFFARFVQGRWSLLPIRFLADMVTSGVAPGFVMYFLLSNSQHEILQ
jgi:CDP-diacylglycerol--serine O-phosphatidyltransferase